MQESFRKLLMLIQQEESAAGLRAIEGTGDFATRYNLQAKLGAGHFAEVHKCTHCRTGEKWAVNLWFRERHTY